jgi:outer membrane protein insertion porin family
MDTKWAIGFDLTDQCPRYISKEYDFETVSLVLRAETEINKFWRYGVQYRLSNGHVDLHGHGDHIKGLRHDSNVGGLISGIGPWISFDTTNHPINPSQGFRSRLGFEYDGLGGDHHFMNFAYANTYFFPVGSRFVMKYRADFRFIQPLGHTHFDTIPLEERIFLGGEYMVRGFRPYRLGPHYEHNRDVPMGGLSLQYFSIEMNRRLTENWDVFAFMDAGHLSKKPWEFGRMSMSIGYGTRFAIPWIPSIPPVTLGMGYPLNAHHRSDVKNFFFSFGGNY